MSPRTSDLAAIEALVCRDVGRGTQALIDATRGDLAAAATALSKATSVGLLTGFYVPRGDTPGPETDGPVGTALLAAALVACGVPARIAVDRPCVGSVRACVAATGQQIGVDEVADATATVAAWRAAGISHVISIERCGRSPDGKPRNMRGTDVSPWTMPFDDLFFGGPWARLAVGDGGNEIGMGKVPYDTIARTVPNGSQIACVTSCDHLVVAGVSNWGAYGLMAALAVVRPDWSETIGRFLTAKFDADVTRAVVDVAGAVDGVTARQEATVDGLPPEAQAELIDGLRRIAWGKARH